MARQIVEFPIVAVSQTFTVGCCTLHRHWQYKRNNSSCIIQHKLSDCTCTRRQNILRESKQTNLATSCRVETSTIAFKFLTVFCKKYTLSVSSHTYRVHEVFENAVPYRHWHQQAHHIYPGVRLLVRQLLIIHTAQFVTRWKRTSWRRKRNAMQSLSPWPRTKATWKLPPFWTWRILSFARCR